MEYQKPEWLLKAEEQINEFAETPAGKRTEGKQKMSESGMIGGKLSGNSNKTKKRLSEMALSAGIKGGFSAKEKKAGFHSMDKNERIELSKQIGNKLHEDKKGLFKLTKEEQTKFGKLGYEKSLANRTTEEKKETAKKVADKLSKKVDAYIYKTGEYVGTYSSMNEAGRQLNISSSCICNILKNRAKSRKGYTFKYK